MNRHPDPPFGSLCIPQHPVPLSDLTVPVHGLYNNSGGKRYWVGGGGEAKIWRTPLGKADLPTEDKDTQTLGLH